MTDDTSNMPPNERTAVVKRLTRVYDGFLKIDEALVSHPRHDGGRQTVTRQCMERGDSVAVLIVDTSAHKVWLTEQFRYPTLAKGPGWIEEVPAGMLKDEEDFETAATREVAEETGIKDLTLEHISTFYVSPGGTSERTILYAAFVEQVSPDLAYSRAHQDKDEDIALVDRDIDEFIQAAIRGDINDAKTLIAGLWLNANLHRLDTTSKD